jgi:hypothetical protein
MRRSQGPSYIDDSNLFVDVLLDVLHKESELPIQSNQIQEAQRCIESLKFYTPAQSFLLDRINVSSIQNLDAFKLELKNLYEEVQRRSSGVYKRNAKGLSFLVGLFVASVANADTFNIIANLTRNGNGFSEELVRQLEADPDFFNCGDDPNKCFDESKQAKFKSLVSAQTDLPLGWNYNQSVRRKLDKEQLELEMKQLRYKNETINLAKENRNNDIKANQASIGFLEKFACTNNDPQNTDGQQSCLQQLAQSYYIDKDAPTTPLAKELSVLITASKDGDDAFREQYKKLLADKKNLQKRLLEQYLVEESDTKIIKQKNDIRIQKIEEEIKNLEVGLMKQPAVPVNAKEVVDQVLSFDGLMWTNVRENIQTQGGWLRVAFGWIITAIALSMGAPFWFDLLSRIMNVRNTAKISEKSESERSNSQQAGGNPNSSETNPQRQ